MVGHIRRPGREGTMHLIGFHTTDVALIGAAGAALLTAALTLVLALALYRQLERSTHRPATHVGSPRSTPDDVHRDLQRGRARLRRDDAAQRRDIAVVAAPRRDEVARVGEMVVRRVEVDPGQVARR